MNTNREQLINELAKLHDDIDQCIGDIVDSRLKKDYKAEGKALFRMEGLMVATLQDLGCTIDYLKLKQNEESQYSDFKELKASELTGNFKPLDMEIVKTGDKIVIYDINPNKANHLTHPVGLVAEALIDTRNGRTGSRYGNGYIIKCRVAAKFKSSDRKYQNIWLNSNDYKWRKCPDDTPLSFYNEDKREIGDHKRPYENSQTISEDIL